MLGLHAYILHTTLDHSDRDQKSHLSAPVRVRGWGWGEVRVRVRVGVVR
jgi:hypothetical protein